MSDAAAKPQNMRSLERALELLAVLQNVRTPLRLSEVARLSGLHIATTQRILGTLAKYGYVQQDGVGYTMGIASLLNAHAFLVSDTLSLVATPVLQQLATTTGLTASLSVRVGTSQVLLVRIEGAHPLKYQLPVGEQLPLHLGGARVLASALGEDELEAFIDSVGTIKLVSGEELTPAEFRRNLQDIREQGFAFGNNQREIGAGSVAVPIFDRSGAVIASMQLSGRAEEFTESLVAECVTELKNASDAITRRIP